MICNLGCGDETYGDVRVNLSPSKTATHVFDIEKGLPQDWIDRFDEVYERNLLEHLKNVGYHLDECYRVLKKGGRLVLITDNAACTRYYLPLIDTHRGRYERQHGDDPRDRHRSVFTDWHLRNRLRDSGFDIFSIEYIGTETRGRFLDILTGQKPRIRVVAIK